MKTIKIPKSITITIPLKKGGEEKLTLDFKKWVSGITQQNKFFQTGSEGPYMYRDIKKALDSATTHIKFEDAWYKKLMENFEESIFIHELTSDENYYTYLEAIMNPEEKKNK